MKALAEYLEKDPEFARELIDSFSENIIEVREALLQALKLQDSKIFLHAHHKVKPTLSYTGNDRLQQLADQIKWAIVQSGLTSVDDRSRNAFCRMCTNSVIDLKEQLKQYLKMSA